MIELLDVAPRFWWILTVESGNKFKSEPPSSGIKDEILPALVQQCIVLIIAGMVLDGGDIGRICLSAMAGFWGGVIVLRIRQRGRPPTKVDLLLIRGGYLLVCVISYLVTMWIWHLRGFC